MWSPRLGFTFASLCLVRALAQDIAQVQPEGAIYHIRLGSLAAPIVTARVGAQIDRQWVYSSDYPTHQQADAPFSNSIGRGRETTITHSGAPSHSDLICTIRRYDAQPFVEIGMRVANQGTKTITVQAIRMLDSTGPRMLDLGGPDAADRVYSDSYSENRPIIHIVDLGHAPGGVHRGSWSQLVYNRESRQSLFVGALTGDRLLTLIHLNTQTFTVDSTGTTEIQKLSTMHASPPADQIELSLEVPPGQSLAAEPVIVMAGRDYHAQLETYGRVIRDLHHARVSAPNLIGWWSWTALYSAISDDTLLTNAMWLSDHLRLLGYEFFHIDEGYQYARGEYSTPDASRFPRGMLPVAHEIARQGLKLGLWTAPFEVSKRAWVYENHKDWLVHNAAGEPIQLGREVTNFDNLYALDTTHPEAQEYLRQTYRTLTREWGARYFKFDFMDDTTVEGFYHKPNTTALEAQRIGLEIIRQTVGDDVLIDKDGSPMLTPVGLVDAGRISNDTAHEFARNRNAANGLAARYYMNRNFFINDPDAFCVSRQKIGEVKPKEDAMTLDEARASIAMAALSGGMYEIGDDLPSLGGDRERLLLVENYDLLNMARLSRAARPMDLMSFLPEDEQPSIFVLEESRHYSVVAVFNWTNQPRTHHLRLKDLGIEMRGPVTAYDVFDQTRPVPLHGDELALDDQAPHSVRMFRLSDTSVAQAAPGVTIKAPASAQAGDVVHFAAEVDPKGVPALHYEWHFGDGTMAEGREVTHAYTIAGSFGVGLAVDGIDRLTTRMVHRLQVNGTLKTPFPLEKSRRYVQ